jgi:Type IV secretion system proteins
MKPHTKPTRIAVPNTVFEALTRRIATALGPLSRWHRHGNTAARKAGCSVLACLALLSGTAFASGVPTTDLAAALQRNANQLAQMAAMADQLAQLTAQYERMGQQLKAITEARDLKALLGIKDIETLIDSKALAAIKRLESTGISEVGIVNNTHNHTQAIKAAEAIDKRKQDIAKLVTAASNTTDAKASADLTARAVALNATLLNEMLYQMEMQKAAAAKNILDEYKLRQESYSHYAVGRANPFKMKAP